MIKLFGVWWKRLFPPEPCLSAKIEKTVTTDIERLAKDMMKPVPTSEDTQKQMVQQTKASQEAKEAVASRADDLKKVIEQNVETFKAATEKLDITKQHSDKINVVLDELRKAKGIIETAEEALETLVGKDIVNG